MTGRERLQALFAGQPTDRLAWTTLVDEHTLNALPGALRGTDGLTFYRHLGCAIFSLAGWSTGHWFASPRLVLPGVEERTYTDAAGFHVIESTCARGTLVGKLSPHWHPVEYPVKSAADVRVLIARFEDAEYVEVDDGPAYAKMQAAIGDDGIVTHFLAPSTIPWLLENLVGVETFYYLMADEPELMDALIRLMQAKERARFAIAAAHPCPVSTLAENTSTAYISPELYARYNLASQRDFVDAMHAAGKTAILHMCGHVHRLLPLIKETGADGIHTLTPPPLGDCPWEDALDVLGDDLIILGCPPPEWWLTCPLEDVAPTLDRVITPRLRASRFVLNPMADGIAVPLERFEAVARWVEERG
jgi:hypothetical protein